MKPKSTITKAILASALLLFTASAQAQITYTWDANAATGDDVQWNIGNPNRWAIDPGAVDPLVSPGSLFNGGVLTDVVIIPNVRNPNAAADVRLTTDAGTIGELTIGGFGTSTGRVDLEIRTNLGALVVTGPTTLGSSDGGNFEGALIMNNGNAQVVVDDVVSDTPDDGPQIQIGGNTGCQLTLNGDIDTAAARLAAGLSNEDVNVIDLRFQRGNVAWAGVGIPQTLNVEQFDVRDSGTNYTDTDDWDIPADVTINASQDSAIVRVTGTANRNFDVDLDVFGEVNYAANLLIGTTTNSATSTGVGTLNVEDGTVNVDGQLQMGFSNSAAHSMTGVVNLNTATSIFTVDGGMAMGSGDGTTSATLTVNDGKATIGGPITNGVAVTSTSTIAVTGGELELLGAQGVRSVDTLTFSGGTIDFLVNAGSPTLSVADATLAAVAGDSNIDLTAAPSGDQSFDDSILATWDNGGGDMDWDTATNWDGDLVPSQALGAIATSDVLTLVSSTNDITNAGNAQLDAGITGWTIDQSNLKLIEVTRTGAPIAGSGHVRAVIDSAVTVNRGTSLRFEPGNGDAADATGLDISSSAILSVTGDLTLGGTAAAAVVNQSGTSDVNVSGDLLFGGAGGTQGGVYNLDGGTLDVTGDIIEGDTGAPDGSVNQAQLFIDGGTLTVGGDITTQRFVVGSKVSSTGNFTATGVDITTTGYLAVGELGDGTLDLTDSTVIIGAANAHAIAAGTTSSITLRGTSSMTSSSGEVHVSNLGTGSLTLEGSASLTHTGGNIEIAEGATGNGTLTMNSTGTITLNTNNLLVSQAVGSTAVFNMNSGTLDIIEVGGNGRINFNSGDGTVNMTGGTMNIDNDIQFSSNADVNCKARWNQSGGTVNIDDSLLIRGNGDDQIDLSGTATLKLGQDATTPGNLDLNDASNAGVGGNVLWLRGDGVTLEAITGTGANLQCDTDTTINWEFNDTGVSAIKVGNGTANGGAGSNVTLNGCFANFTWSGSIAPPSLGTFTLIDNQGPNAVTGTFDSLPDLATVLVSGQLYQLTYFGGDGNDVTLEAVNTPFVTITPGPTTTEGGTATWTVNAVPAPSGYDIIVDLAYEGTATSVSGDFTETAQVTITDGTTSAPLSVTTNLDSVHEGCETIVAIIDFLDVSTGSVFPEFGIPDEATVTLVDGPSTPSITNIEQVAAGTGTIDLKDIVVTDWDAGFSSAVTTTEAPYYHFNGGTNLATFESNLNPPGGIADQDNTFDLDLIGPALNDAAGMSVDLTFIPQAADLSGTVVIWDGGGANSRNGTSILLVDGVLHLLSKANSLATKAPTDDGAVTGAFNDLDWEATAGDETIVVPLTTTPVATQLTAGLPAQLAVVYDIIGGTVKYSVNGSAEATATLLNRATNSNWNGNHTFGHAVENGHAGGTTTVVGSPFENGTILPLAGGPAAISCFRFWNESAGSATGSGSGTDTITATLTIQGHVDDATSGSLTATSGNGESYPVDSGVWTVSGTAVAVNAALAAVQFVEGTGLAPHIIDVSIDDGGTPQTGTIYITGAAPDPVYVDDAWAGSSFLDAITDVDPSTAGDQNGVFGVDAFDTISGAVASADQASGTVIVNDGTYLETVLMTGTGQTLRLNDLDDVGGISSVTIAVLDVVRGTDPPAAAGNLVDLDSNSLTIGDTADVVFNAYQIDCPIVGTGAALDTVLTKEGDDRLILREICTYTGKTVINDGFLRIGHIGDPDNVLLTLHSGSLDGDGEVEVNAAIGPLGEDYGVLEFNPNIDTTMTQTGVISGDGSVRIADDGTLVFDGAANTFTGRMWLGDGTGSTVDADGNGTPNGFVVVSDDEHLGLGVVEARGAQLRAASAGINIANDIELLGGALRVGGGAGFFDFELSGTISPIDNPERTIGHYGLDGRTITLSGGLDMDQLGTPIGINIQGTNDADNGELVIGSVANPSTGGGFIEVINNFDGGTITMLGSNTYTGYTDIDSGTFLLGAASTHTGGGIYTVDGATLGGSGSTDAAVTVGATGTIAPGASIGSLAIGPLTLAGTLSIEVEDTTGVAGTDWDELVVTGAVDVTAGTLEVIDGGAVEAAPTPIIVMDTSAGITNPFASGVPFSGDYRGSGKTGQVSYLAGVDFSDLQLLATSNSIIGAWRLVNFGSPANLAPGENTGNGDGDTSDNLLEFGYGTDPTSSDGGSLTWDGGVGTVVGGQPVVVDADTAPKVWFMRRTDDHLLGSAGVTLELSGSLIDWEIIDPTATEVILDTAGSYELVQVPFPATLSGSGLVPRFVRVHVTENVTP